MPKSVVSIFLLLVAFLAQAQNLELKIIAGELVKDDFKKTSIANVPDENGGLFEIKYRKKQYFIQHYNSNLQKDAEYIHEVAKERIVKVFVLNKKLHFIELVGNKTTKEAVFTIFQQTDSGLKFESKKLFAISYSHLGFMTKLDKLLAKFISINASREGDNNNYPFALTIAKNQKYYALSFDDFSKKRESFRFYLLDHGHQIIFQKTLELPQKDKNYFFYDFEIDQKVETIYFLGKDYPKGSGLGLKMPRYEYELHRMSISQNDHIKIARNGLKINDLSLYINEQNNWVSCIGLYSEQSDFSTEGLAYFSFDRTSFKPVFAEHSKFSPQFKEDTKRKKEKYDNLNIDEIIETSKGDVYILGEERKILDTQVQFGNGAFPTTYYFSDIFLAKMDVKGNLIWSRAINKNQQATRKSDFGYMSYTSYLKDDNKFNLIFNASEKIVKLKDGSDLFNFTGFKKVVPFILTFDNAGNYTYRQLLDQQEKIFLRVRNSVYKDLVNPSELFFLGKSMNKEQWFKFEIE
jgi:hypothetical protein